MNSCIEMVLDSDFREPALAPEGDGCSAIDGGVKCIGEDEVMFKRLEVVNGDRWTWWL